MQFSKLALRAELLRAIEAQQYTSATPVQQQAIPIVLEGRDLLAGAQTGTGKTAAFTLPILERLAASLDEIPLKKRRAPRVLVLTPTRELAAQVAQSIETYGQFLPLRSTAVFGGVGIEPQKDKIRRGLDILVATPGRLLDLVNQRAADLSKIEILVLDEADRMLDMGFIHDIRKVLALLPAQRQNLLFSATYSDEIRQLADSILHKPAMVEVARRNTAAETVTQKAYRIDRGGKRELLRHLIEAGQWYQVLVFARTKHGADRLARQLQRSGIETDAIHGDKSQGARTRALGRFKKGKLRVLVATDIAARGLDIDKLPYVVNFDLPHVAEDYVHRIGRTGRAGEEGMAISLVADEESKLLKAIERLLKKPIEVLPLPQFERKAPVSKPQPEKTKSQGGKSARSGNRSGTKRPRRGARGGKASSGNQRPAGNGGGRKKRSQGSQARQNVSG